MVGSTSRASCTSTRLTNARKGFMPLTVKRSIMAWVIKGRTVPRKVMVTMSQNTVESRRTGKAEVSSIALTNTTSRTHKPMRLR